MRISIATRVSTTCAAVLALSVLLLGASLTVGQEVHRANQQVGRLSRLLDAQDHKDQAQRKLRLAIGDATRAAEQHRAVPDGVWAGLTADLNAFETLSVTAFPTASAASAEAGAAMVETHEAALAFVVSGRQLAATSRRSPDAIKGEMPGFLTALKRLETARTETRRALIDDINRAAELSVAKSRGAVLRLFAAVVAALAALFAMTIWLRRRVISPIVEIAACLRDFDGEAMRDAPVPGLDHDDELGDLARGLSEYREAVEERRTAQRKVAFLAHHDLLTGLPNRLMFETRLADELARCRRTGDQVAVFAVDLDGFKSINDRHGHAGGDRALKRAAKLLSNCIRNDDMVARIGGDEFAMIQVSDQQPLAAEALLTRLFQASAATAAEAVEIRMSVGVALSGSDRDGEELYNLADTALYRAKADGRNTARFFDTGLQDEIRLRRRLARDLERAIDADELSVAFQPIADSASLRRVGYDALLRWRHPELGDVAPGVFISIAESVGLIGRIGAWMADRAVATAASWDPALTLSINLSPIQFRDTDLAPALLALADRHRVAPDRLEIEVTESATLLGHQRDAVLETLRLLQAAGARIAMDDFGTGHSSLSNLKDFGFDKLKIDRSFVAAMLTHQPSASIVRATIGLGKSLGVTIVAEGVETEAQLDQLRRWGCDQVQGYLIGRPADRPSSTPAGLLTLPA